MNPLNFFRSVFCGDYLQLQNKYDLLMQNKENTEAILKQQLLDITKERDAANQKATELSQENLVLTNQNNGLRSAFNQQVKDQEGANYYNNRYQKNDLKYPALQQDGKVRYRDPRSFIPRQSHILGEVKFTKTTGNDDLMWRIFSYVKNRLTYKADTGEEWKEPEVTYQEKFGDCEDGSILMLSLAILNGIPNYRAKCYGGTVQAKNGSTTGHCWLGYRRESDNKIVPMDWCWYPSDARVEKRIPMGEQSTYFKGEKIWWSFNNEFTWSEKEIILPQRVKE